MKTYKVIYSTDTKGKETQDIIIKANKFNLVSEKGYRGFCFFDKCSNPVAVFSAEKVTAIYEV